jgi:hypothetical protein
MEQWVEVDKYYGGPYLEETMLALRCVEEVAAKSFRCRPAISRRVFPPPPATIHGHVVLLEHHCLLF